MEYTKGEWKALDTGHVVAGSGFDMKVIVNCLSQPEAEANARLIASAPDLYEALKEATRWIEYRSVRADKEATILIEGLRQALAKAEEK